MNAENVINPESLDWSEVLKRWNESSTSSEKPSEEESIQMNNTLEESYPSVLVERLHLEPEWSVLDMGCGDGALAIPIAKRVRSVLAIDQLEPRIQNAIEFAKREGVSDKITFVTEKLHDAVQSGRIHPCDVVLASRSVGLASKSVGRPVNDVKRDLAIIDSLAKKRVYLTVYNGDQWSHYEGAFATVGRKLRRNIWSPVVMNTLWQMKIRPNVDHFESEDSSVTTALTMQHRISV